MHELRSLITRVEHSMQIKGRKELKIYETQHKSRRLKATLFQVHQDNLVSVNQALTETIAAPGPQPIW